MKHRRGLGGKGTLRAAWHTVVDALEALAARRRPAIVAARELLARVAVRRVPRQHAVGDRDDLVARRRGLKLLREAEHRRVVDVLAVGQREALVDLVADGVDRVRAVLRLAEEGRVAAGDVAVAPVERTGVSCQAHRKREAGRGART